MKFYLKILATFILVTFLLAVGFIFKKDAFSQTEFNFAKALEDYSYNVNIYNKAVADYQAARAQYLQIGTLATKDAARDATYKMLVARDEVVRTYLTALRMKLKETDGVVPSERESSFSQIDQEVSWYQDHKNRIPSAGSLDDLVDDSNKAKDHYNSTQIVIYTGLIRLESGKLAFLRNEMTKVVSDLKLKIAEIRQNGDKNVAPIERSLVDVENKLTRSSEKEQEAKNKVYSIKVADRDKASSYDEASSKLQESYLYLKEANTNLKEVIRQIKTAD